MPAHQPPIRPRSLALALAILSALALGACNNADPAAMIAEARAYREQGDYRAAVIQLKNAVQKDAGNRGARLMLAELYLEQGDPASAEKELRRALALGADGGSVTLMLGKTLLMQGQYERILADINADAAPAQRPALLALRGNALLGQGKTAPATDLFQEALRLQPDAPEALLGLARIAVWRKQPDAGAILLERALAAHPGDIECLRYQGDLLRAAGKPDEALASHQKILKAHPNNAQALVDAANLHTDAGRYGQARESLAAARKITGASLGVMYSEAMLAYRENKLAPALETVQQVLRAAPEHLPSLLLAATIESAQGAHQQAGQHLQKFLETYPGHPYASKLMTAIELAAKRPEAAMKRLRPLLAEAPDDIELLALAGEASLLQRQFSAAAGYFEKASALKPEAPMLHTGLALSRMGSGDNARAVAELERAASLEKDPGRNGVLLVMTYLRANMPDKALKLVLEMEKQGDNPLIQNLKGGIYMARQDLPAARASFDKALALDPAYLPALSNLQQLDRVERKTADTEKRYLAALAKSPSNGALMEALAQLSMAANNPAAAIAWIERAGAAQPDALPLALRTGMLYLRAGQAGKALVLAQKLQAAHPASADALALLGQASVASRQFGPAAEAYARMALLAPGSGTPHLHLANVHIRQKQYSAAQAALTKALAIEPDLLDARITLVNLLVKQNKFTEALATATALQKRQPDAAAGYKLEADVHSAQGRHGAALAAYQRAFKAGPGGPLLIQLYGALVRLDRQAEADASVMEWLRQHPGDVPTRLYYASTRLVKNDPRGAIPHFEAVLVYDPDNLAALNDLAWSYQRAGDAKALAFAQRAFALAPENPAVIDTLGWIYLEQGQLARALPLLQKASALAPNAGEIHYHLAMVLVRSGDKRGARRELEKALAAPSQFARRAEAKALLATL